ncbi:homogentisate phytyltransferase [Leifsonia sp. LS1]|nr:homogentisate phytyltransferase [Leifsonia sp. LS1]
MAFQEGRPVVIGVFALRFIVGSALIAGADWSEPLLWAAGVSWLLAVWGVYLVNGISDVEGDRLNGSARPLATGRLSMRFAVGFVVTLLTVSLLIGTLIDIPFLAAVVAFIALGLLYSLGPWAAKNIGAAALGVAAAGTFLTYVAAAHVATGSVPPSTYVFALFGAAWIAVVGHTKDFGDVAGDASAGRRTLPVALGEGRARLLVAAGTGVVSVAALVCAVVVDNLRTLLALGIAGPLVILAIVQARGGDRRRQKRPYRTFMVGQYALNIAAIVVATGG